MITIQGFAKLCGCNTQTLRYYDRIGLLAPAKVDEWTGYRYYEEDQAMRFVKIKNLQQADFPSRRYGRSWRKTKTDSSKHLSGRLMSRSRNWNGSEKYKDRISKKPWICRI